VGGGASAGPAAAVGVCDDVGDDDERVGAGAEAASGSGGSALLTTPGDGWVGGEVSSSGAPAKTAGVNANIQQAKHDSMVGAVP
jgi:hypothetical protein